MVPRIPKYWPSEMDGKDGLRDLGWDGLPPL
jgi:hypothetical protein